jgi:hypothetical protein
MRRPQWPQGGPNFPKTDEFGLPSYSLLLERADEQERRLRLVRRFAFRAYRVVCGHLGEEEARKLFGGFISEPRRMGRPRGPSSPTRARELLARYDQLAAVATSPAERAKLPRKVAESFATGRTDTAEADEKHLRRLIRQQDRKTALFVASQARHRRRTMGHAPETRSLLGEALSGERDKK